MSLATRCPACGTVFRVVQDQLRVSEGWVRCGRCSEVFNAVDHMVDLPRPTTPQPPPTGLPGPGPAGSVTDALAGSLRALDLPSPPPQALEQMIESDHAHDLRIRAWNDPGPAEEVLPAAPFDEDDERTRVFPAFDALASSEAAMAAGPQEAAPEAEAALDPEASPAGRDAAPPDDASPSRQDIEASADPVTADAAATRDGAPSFLRDAERAERWQRPAVRWAMAAGLVLGLGLLALQVALEYRDLVAARWVGTRPALEQLCRWTGCRVEHPRLVDALVVDSSGLVRVDGTNTYRFSVVLRNRSSLRLAMPAIDLTLTDTQGRVISRRTLSAVELGVGAPTVAAAAELPMQATLGIADRPVAGYTIEVFYP